MTTTQKIVFSALIFATAAQERWLIVRVRYLVNRVNFHYAPGSLEGYLFYFIRSKSFRYLSEPVYNNIFPWFTNILRLNLAIVNIGLALASSPVTPFYSVWKGRTPLHFINLNLLALCPTLTVRLYVVKVQIAWRCGIFSHSVRIYEVFFWEIS